MYVDSDKHKPVPPIDVSNIIASIMKDEKGEDKEIQLSFSMKKLIDAQSSDTFSCHAFHVSCIRSTPLYLLNMYCIKHMMH